MRRYLWIFGAMLLITIAHYMVPTKLVLWHEILERLYYLPIAFAALSFGLIGGLTAAACARRLLFATHSGLMAPFRG